LKLDDRLAVSLDAYARAAVIDKLDFGSKEANLAKHFFCSFDLVDEVALKSVDLAIQLRSDTDY
jgi:hypothetical protein